MTPSNISGKDDQLPLINKQMPVTEIVQKDYRTADVFLKYDIEFCCGGKWPLEMVCESKQLDTAVILLELEEACRLIQLPQGSRFEDWGTGFLIDFIQNVYHRYFKKALETTVNYTNRFLEGHLKKFPELEKTPEILHKLSLAINKRMNNEEESFFPYIKQVTNAYLRNESYAGLLVKTLRKPWQETMQQEYSEAIKWLDELRSITKDYYLPDNACTTHRVSFLKLRELDHELTQYLQLEHTILLPRVVEVEQALLA